MSNKQTRLGNVWLSLSAAGAVFALASCAQDGFDDSESFSSSVRNTQLLSPAADKITVTPTADKSRMTISWPTVGGASAFDVELSYAADGKNIQVVDSVIDGNSFAVKRVEDVRYNLSIKTLANTSLGNSDAKEATALSFLTVDPSFATIPAGTDLYEYFKANPVAESKDLVMFDLEKNGHYTLSKKVDFCMANIGLRTAEADGKATITLGDSATICFCNGLTLKNLIIDASASTQPTVSLSKEGCTLPAVSSFVVINNPVLISGCEISGVNESFLRDNGVNYCIANMSVDKTIIKFTSSKEGVSGTALFYMKGGFINELVINRSTLWNAGPDDAKYIIQYNNNGRCSRAGFLTNTVAVRNSTFHNLAVAGQFANYNGFAGQKTSMFELTNNIFSNCSPDFVRRFLGGRNAGSYPAANLNFANNTYMNADGTFQSTDGIVPNYDESGTAIEADPQFADPANGNFTVGAAEQKAAKTGDPRWL